MKKDRKIDFKSRLLRKLHSLQLSARRKFLEMRGNDPQLLTDPLDRSSMETNQNVAFMIHDRERKAMREIEDALQKLEQGVFGICENCGCEIGETRLLVSPASRLCISCQEKQEKKNRLKRLILTHAV
ncbi:MAG: TraR/DksA C4-type zinc finger protein [Syntrophaceae bacterium]|nr:TraR/DksA C4-type zinc finger protein [Syntrophaceae bacterium]